LQFDAPAAPDLLSTAHAAIPLASTRDCPETPSLRDPPRGWSCKTYNPACNRCKVEFGLLLSIRGNEGPEKIVLNSTSHCTPKEQTMRPALRHLIRKPLLPVGLTVAMIYAGWSLRADDVPAGAPTDSPTAAPAEEHPLVAPLRIAKLCRQALENVPDYTCRFVKRDVVDGQTHAHQAVVKFREEPFSVYMRFEGERAGREVLYVAGQNDGRLVAREKKGLGSLVGAVMLDPESRQALSESRRPITAFGLRNQLETVIAQWEAEARFAAPETQTRYYESAKLQGMDCQVIETFHPVRRQQFEFFCTRLYIDKATRLPVRVEQYGFPAAPGQQPPLLEEATYWDVRTGVGLTDRDFDRRNPEYGF
jgi:hypothetical protein